MTSDLCKLCQNDPNILKHAEGGLIQIYLYTLNMYRQNISQVNFVIRYKDMGA